MMVTDIFLGDVKNSNVFMMLTSTHDKLVKDPLMGLAKTTNEYPTFLDKLKENNIIDKVIFTIDIKKNNIIFGTFESKMESITVPNKSKDSYVIEIGEFTYGD